MGGKQYFPIAVDIAFGCDPMDLSPTWTDVSHRVLRSRTISASRGAGESGGVDPGRGQIVLANDSGDFTPGDTGSFGLFRNRLPVRIRAVLDAWENVPTPPTSTSDVIWTGLLEKATMGFDGGVRPIVTCTLVDRWARLKARTLTGDRIQQVCQVLDCADLWPLTEPAGSSRAASLTSGWALMTQVGNAAGWGLSSNPHSASTGLPSVVRMPNGAWIGSTWNESGATPAPTTYASAFTVSMWVRCSTLTGPAEWLIDEENSDGIRFSVYQDAVGIKADPSLGVGYGQAAVTASAAWRHFAATVDFTGASPVLTAWLDGVQVYTRTATSAWRPYRLHSVGGYNVDLAYAATWDRVLTSAEIQSITAAGSNALGASSGQTGETRAALVAGLWSPTSITVQGSWTATMSKQSIEGVSQADLLQACATAEGGMVYMGRDGWPVLQSKGHRTNQTLFAAIPAKVLASDAQWELDDAQIVNVVQVDRMAIDETVSTVNRRNQASIDAYGEVSKSWQVWLDTDVQAVDRANVESTMWADPSPRSRTFAVDLATCRNAFGLGFAVNVDIGSRITISGLPSTAPDQSAAGWYVDAIADDITEASWRRTFTVSPAIDFLVIDDATFGALDEWPIG